MRRLVLTLALLASGAAAAQSSATYRVTLDATWSAQTHPEDFPGDPHFSPLVGAVHSADARLWRAGDTASDGIESMAETGNTSALRSEITSLSASGSVLSTIEGGWIPTSPGTVGVDVTVTEEHSLVTLVTMLAPSPDWFIGTESFDLQTSDGSWKTEATVSMRVWDAGTDSGTMYTSPNADTSPREPIALIQDVPFFVGGAFVPTGTMTFSLVSVVATDEAPEADLALDVTPNPIRGTATIRVQHPASGDIALTLYDVRGRAVRDLNARPLAGTQAVPLDTHDLAPGVYLLRLVSAGQVQTRQVVIAW